MAARTFTSAGVNNLWSNVANWDGGATIPQEDDSVTIPAGQTCEYDYNSAYTTGIAGITITGTLKLTRTAGTYRLFMKAATTIGGAGTFDCGASALDPIPFTAKHTITGGSGWYIDGAAGMTMTVYAAEPAIKSILLSGAEAAGQTELSVDTDVTGDIWAVGDTVLLSDNYYNTDVENRVIAAGGIASGAITVTAGLTAAKVTGCYLILATRNVQFLGTSTSVGIIKSFASGKLTISGGYYYNPRLIFDTCYLTMSNGVCHTATFVLSACVMTISGGYFITANTGAGVAYNSGGVVSGGFFAGGTAIFSPVNYSISITGGVLSGGGSGISGGGVSTSLGACTIRNCTQGVVDGRLILANGTIFDKNYYGISNSNVKLNNCTFTNTVANDIKNTLFSSYNSGFGSAVENLGYTNIVKEFYSESIDHDQIAGAYKAWTSGGVTTKQTTTKPTGETYSMQTVLESATIEGYWQKEVSVGAGASVNITSWLRKDASMTYLPRVIIFNKASTDPFAGGAGLHTFTMTDSIDTWESDLYTYTNSTSEDITLVIRCQGMNATGNLYSLADVEQINVDLTSAIAKIDVVDGIVDAIKAITDQFVFTVANQVDANALTGGGGATAEDVRIEIDANSTQLASLIAGVTLADDAITAAKFDESTAFPVKSADTGATQIARVGADSDTLETLSDQMDGIATWSAAAISASYTAGAISDIRGSSWSIAMTDLTLDSNKQQFVIKRKPQDTDADAILFVDSATGLITLNGVSTGLTAADAALVYAGTTLTLTVKANVTAQLPVGVWHYGIQYVTAAGLVEEPYGGTFTVTADIVRATT